MEAPPEEEVLEDDALGLDADQDLGYASMFAEVLGRTEPTSVPEEFPSPRLVEQEEITKPTPSSSKFNAGSIALGGLLAATTPSEDKSSSFGLTSQQYNPLGLPFSMIPKQNQFDSLIHEQTGVGPGAGPLTSQELEAQLMQASAASGHPASKAYGTQLPLQAQGQETLPGYPSGYSQSPQAGIRRQVGVFTPEMIMMMQQQQQQQQQNKMTGGEPPGAGPSTQFPGIAVQGPAPRGMYASVPDRPVMMPPPGILARPPPPGIPIPHFLAGQNMQEHTSLMPKGTMQTNEQGQALGKQAPSYLQTPMTKPTGFEGHICTGTTDNQYQRRTNHPHASLAQRLRALHLADRKEQIHGPMMRRRLRSSQCMGTDEIDSILGMQWRSLHQGNPYIEDHYYQAFLYKYYGRRNKKTFAPESVRELAPTEKVTPDEIAFVKLEGLGRVPFSNIRRPRPLMEVAPEDSRSETNGIEKEEDVKEGRPVKRLGQEPMLAARIMVEDCMALILDVQDIDRIFIATSEQKLENHDELLRRRELLVNGLAASLRLSEDSVISGSDSSDGVFLRLLTLTKGRTLVSRALQQSYPPSEASMDPKDATSDEGPNLCILWAVLRNSCAIFNIKPQKSGKYAAEKEMKTIGATSRLAESAVEVIKQLHSLNAVCNAMGALIHGDIKSIKALEGEELPLFASSSRTSGRIIWLADVITALLQRSAEFELSSNVLVGSETDQDLRSNWSDSFNDLKNHIVKYLKDLRCSMNSAKSKEEVHSLKNAVPLELVRSLMALTSKEDEKLLKEMLTDLHF